MISSDDQFRPIGPRTNIDWMSEYISYKRILVKNAEHPDIKSLFVSLNRSVFGVNSLPAALPTPSPQAAPAPQNSLLRMEQAFAQASMNIAVSNSDPSGGNQHDRQAGEDAGGETDTHASVGEAREADTGVGMDEDTSAGVEEPGECYFSYSLDSAKINRRLI